MLEFLSSRARDWVAMVGSPETAAAIAFLVLILIVDLALRGWRMSWSRRSVEGVGATLSLFHLNFLFAPLVWVCSEHVRELYGLAGIPSVPTDVWTNVPVWLLVPFAIVVHDFANYCNHRLMHLPLLWPIHAIHHSDPDVNGLTPYRIHFLEGFVMWMSYLVLLTWLGLPKDVMGLGAVLITLHNIYVHINVDWEHGPFRLLLASPRFHRWHHADVPEAHGKNLANVFPFFDWLFGTYYVPGKCEAPVGAEGVPQNDVAALMLWPFKEWTRMAVAQCATLAGHLGWKRGVASASATDPS